MKEHKPFNPYIQRIRYFTMYREMLDSQAFRSMTRTGILVMLDFLSFIMWEDNKTKQKKHNNRDVPLKSLNDQSLPYSFDYARGRGIPYSSFNRALTEIIEHGFLKIVKQGSGLENDPNVYGLTDAWKEWGTDKFKPGERRKAESGRGFKKGNTLGKRFPAQGDMVSSRILPYMTVE